MKRNSKRLLVGLAATSVVSAGLAAGGVAIASTGSAPSPAAATATAAAPPASGWCGGPLAGMRGPWAGRPVMTAAADYLGLSQAQLRAQLDSGKSLADVASARHKPVSGLKDAILAAATSRVNASTGLSAAQKATAISEVKSHLDDIVNATFPGGPGMPGMGGWGSGWHMGPMRGF